LHRSPGGCGIPDAAQRSLLSEAEFQAMYQQSIDAPEEFWAEQAGKLKWFKKWEKVLDDSNPPFYKWLILYKIDSL